MYGAIFFGGGYYGEAYLDEQPAVLVAKGYASASAARGAGASSSSGRKFGAKAEAS